MIDGFSEQFEVDITLVGARHVCICPLCNRKITAWTEKGCEANLCDHMNEWHTDDGPVGHA